MTFRLICCVRAIQFLKIGGFDLAEWREPSGISADRAARAAPLSICAACKTELPCPLRPPDGFSDSILVCSYTSTFCPSLR